MRLIRLGLAASLVVSAVLAMVWSRHWPLVGDASLIHYIAFLIERGWAPYRELGDMNMPGSFLIEIAAMHVFGMDALAWRVFDFTLLGAACVAIFLILGRKNWFAALFASSLFALIHIRDGLAQGGQRDLTMAVCLLAASAFLLVALRREGSRWSAGCFGLLSGIALTIKPTTVIFTGAVMLLAVSMLRLQRVRRPQDEAGGNLGNTTLTEILGPAAAGFLIAPAIALLFLIREHALRAFFAGFHGIVPYYASLGHRPLSYILVHSVSPIISLVILWIAVLALDRATLLPTLNSLHFDLVRPLLWIGVLFGLINCVVQARALPYYRYPLLAFLLPLMALDFSTAVQGRSFSSLRVQTVRTLAAAAILVGSLFLAPQSAILIHRYRWWETDFLTSLEDNLNRLGGQRLSGHVQCIDSVSGCGTVLYRMRLEPATGVLSDFLLFGGVSDGSETPPVVRDTRAVFSAAMARAPARGHHRHQPPAHRWARQLPQARPLACLRILSRDSLHARHRLVSYPHQPLVVA